jgi:hypothetical protein
MKRMFHVGQHVVCVTPGSDGYLIRRQIYTVAKLHEATGIAPDPAIIAIVQVQGQPDAHLWYDEERLAPARRTSIEVFKRLLKPADELVD